MFLFVSVQGEQRPEVVCALHPEVVLVEPDVTDVWNRPQFITVNRCKGSCGRSLDSQKCSPIGINTIHVLVTRADGQRVIRDIEEHSQCECQCQITCEKYHYHDEKNCRCQCIQKCKAGENQDPRTCTCTPRMGKRRDEPTEY